MSVSVTYLTRVDGLSIVSLQVATCSRLRAESAAAAGRGGAGRCCQPPHAALGGRHSGCAAGEGGVGWGDGLAPRVRGRAGDVSVGEEGRVCLHLYLYVHVHHYLYLLVCMASGAGPYLHPLQTLHKRVSSTSPALTHSSPLTSDPITSTPNPSLPPPPPPSQSCRGVPTLVWPAQLLSPPLLEAGAPALLEHLKAAGGCLPAYAWVGVRGKWDKRGGCLAQEGSR